MHLFPTTQISDYCSLNCSWIVNNHDLLFQNNLRSKNEILQRLEFHWDMGWKGLESLLHWHSHSGSDLPTDPDMWLCSVFPLQEVRNEAAREKPTWIMRFLDSGDTGLCLDAGGGDSCDSIWHVNTWPDRGRVSSVRCAGDVVLLDSVGQTDVLREETDAALHPNQGPWTRFAPVLESGFCQGEPPLYILVEFQLLVETGRVSLKLSHGIFWTVWNFKDKKPLTFVQPLLVENT